MVELGSTTVPIMNMLELSAAPMVKHQVLKEVSYHNYNIVVI